TSAACRARLTLPPPRHAPARGRRPPPLNSPSRPLLRALLQALRALLLPAAARLARLLVVGRHLGEPGLERGPVAVLADDREIDGRTRLEGRDRVVEDLAGLDLGAVEPD